MLLSKRISAHTVLTPALLLVILSAVLFSTPALASDITVASPVNGTTVSSPVWIRAHTIGCNGVPPSAFGYSIDGSTATTLGTTPFDVDVVRQGVAAGVHTMHFKSWTANGVCPIVSTSFTVGSGGAAAPSTAPAVTSVPANAIASANLDGATNWIAIHDGGTPGSSRGSSVYPARTPLYDDAREFYMTYSAQGGERWSVVFGRDANATHFILDTYVYLTNPWQVQNLELDLNQVMPNGETVILGTQCSSVTGTWESAYTSGRYDHWLSSSLKCNPHSWSANTWHHVQIAMHRDAYGVVTHDWVNLDGNHQVFSGAVHGAAQSLGWAPGAMVLNYQIEGQSTGSGSVTTYVHKLTVVRW
jgi:hypothetical protein